MVFKIDRGSYAVQKKSTYVGHGKGEGHHNLCCITRTLTVRTKAEITHVIHRFKKGSEMFT